MFKIKKIFSYISLLLLLSSCDGSDSWCWQTGADSYSQANSIVSYISNPVEILAVSAPYENTTDTSGYGVWVNTGFSITAGFVYDISVPGGNGSTIITAPAYNQNLGTTTILASAGTPTPIYDTDGSIFIFAPSQAISVSVNPCTTGTASYGTSAPTKWTWSDNWLYQVVQCSQCSSASVSSDDLSCKGYYSQYLSYDADGNPTGDPTSSPHCIACGGAQNCSGTCASCTTKIDSNGYLVTDCNNTGQICGTYVAWGCNFVTKAFPSDVLPYIYGFTTIDYNGDTVTYPSSTYDVCPATSYDVGDAVPSNDYICQFQSGDTTMGSSAGDGYASTHPGFGNSGEKDAQIDSSPQVGYCDGWYDSDPCDKLYPYYSNSGPTWDEYSATKEMSSESIHLTGNKDTCWNTDGYNLYGILEGVQCPTDEACGQLWLESTDAGDSYNGYQSNGENVMELVTETVVTAPNGGPFYLEIFDPNIDYTSADSTYDTDITNNTTSIDNYNTANNTLYPTLTSDLTLVDNYYTSNSIETLTQDGYSISASGDISDPTAQNYMVAILQYLDGYTPTTGAYIEGVNNSLYSLDQILNNSFNPEDSSWEIYVLPSSYNYADSTSFAPTTYPPSTEYSDMYDLSGNAIVQANALITHLTATATYTPPVLTGSTTSTDIIDYCNSLITTLGELQSSIVTVETTQSQIDYNNAQITTLTEENTQYYADVLSLNNYTPDSKVVGGYTVSVSSLDVEKQYGDCLKAIIVPSGVDPNSALTNADEDPSQFTTIFDFTTDAGSTSTAYTATPLLNTLTYPDVDQYPNGAPTAGVVWMKIYDPDGNYANNSQYYEVDFAAQQTSSGFSTMMEQLISTIKTVIQTTAQNIYLGITCNKAGQDRTTGLCTDYFNSIDILLHMYVVIFGIMYLFGLIKTDYVDFIMRIVKIAIISTLLQPYSLQFFNQYFFQGFYGLTNTLITAATGAPTQNPFDFLTQTVDVLLLDQTTYFKIIGLMFQGLLGLVAFVLMIYGCVSFILALFNAFITYMTAFIGMGLCISVAPIFIIFLLFEKTHHLFENWFKAMVKLTIIPAILLIGLIIINGMLASILQSLLNYEVCFKCTIPFNFAIPGFSIGTGTLFCVSWFSKWGADNVASATNVILMTFPLALNFCILNEVMRLYSDKLALQVAGGIVGSSSVFKARDKNASLGMPFKGITKDFKKMDARIEKMAIRSGVAKNKEEYKKMRNKVVKTTLKGATAVSLGGMLGLAAFANRNKKSLDPQSLSKQPTSKQPTSKQPTLADSIKSASDKRKEVIDKINKGGLTKSQRKKLSKQADKLGSKIDNLDRQKQYQDNGASKQEISRTETDNKLMKKAQQTRETYNNYIKQNRNNQDDPKVAKTIEKLRDLDKKASDRVDDFRKNPDKFMKDEADKKSAKTTKKPHSAAGTSTKTPEATQKGNAGSTTPGTSSVKAQAAALDEKIRASTGSPSKTPEATQKGNAGSTTPETSSVKARAAALDDKIRASTGSPSKTPEAASGSKSDSTTGVSNTNRKF